MCGGRKAPPYEDMSSAGNVYKNVCNCFPESSSRTAGGNVQEHY